MLSNLVNQLREMDALDKIGEVYKELPRVRKELGQIPLVTPTSQIVGIQTVNNVLFDTPDERYKMITAQVKDLCYGLYGKTAVPIDEDVQKKALKGYERGEEPITCRPAEVLEPELEKARAEIGDLAVDMDDLVLYAIYPVTGRKFLQWKYGKEEAPDSVKPITMDEVKKREALVKKALAGELIEKKTDAPAKGENSRTFNVFVDNEYFEVAVDEVGGSPMVRPMHQQIQLPRRHPYHFNAQAVGSTRHLLFLPPHLRLQSTSLLHQAKSPGYTGSPSLPRQTKVEAAPAADGMHRADRAHARHDCFKYAKRMSGDTVE